MNGCYLNQGNWNNRQRKISFQYYTKKKDFVGHTDEIKDLPFTFGKHMASNYLKVILDLNQHLGREVGEDIQVSLKKEWRPLLVKKTC